jgi:hypothetical protein
MVGSLGFGFVPIVQLVLEHYLESILTYVAKIKPLLFLCISGGTWTSSAQGIATVNASTGLVTGIAAGTATITYTITGNRPGCSPLKQVEMFMLHQVLVAAVTIWF